MGREGEHKAYSESLGIEGENGVLEKFLSRETNPDQYGNHDTRAQKNHLLRSLPSNTNRYFNSFLLRTIRDIRDEPESNSNAVP